MARIRTIKPEFFTSLTVASLPVEARLTFIGLWTHVDDEGRCVDDARLIKAAIWPLDDRLAADVEADLRALSEASLITRYKVGERSYLAITNWREHQKINRPTPSKLPPPPPLPDPSATAVDNSSESNRHSPSPAKTTAHEQLTDGSVSAHVVVSEGSPLERNREQGTGNREQGKRARVTALRPRTEADRLFEEFWSVYPRREAKGAARKAWDKAIKRADPAEIIAGARRYRDQPGREPRYTAHAATWLNADRWTDEPLTSANGHRPYRNPVDMSVYEEGL